MERNELVANIAKDLLFKLMELDTKPLFLLEINKSSGDKLIVEFGKRYQTMVNAVSEALKPLDD
jgi:hypothetical protein